MHPFVEERRQLFISGRIQARSQIIEGAAGLSVRLVMPSHGGVEGFLSQGFVEQVEHEKAHAVGQSGHAGFPVSPERDIRYLGSAPGVLQ